MAGEIPINIGRDEQDDPSDHAEAVKELAAMWPDFATDDQERLLAMYPELARVVDGAQPMQMPVSSVDDSIRAFVTNDHSDQSLN